MIKKLIHKLQWIFLPTKHQKELKRWFRDGGDEKLRFNYELQSNDIVFDLGGYKGQWAEDVFNRFKCRVFVFEPVEKFADKIKARFVDNAVISVFPFALGKNDREEMISLFEDGSSVFIDSLEKTAICIKDISHFFQEYSIDRIALLKLNIEGGEYEILRALIENDLVKKIDNIQVQFHQVSPTSEAEMTAIQKELRKTHFPTYQYKFVWENWQLSHQSIQGHE